MNRVYEGEEEEEDVRPQGEVEEKEVSTSLLKYDEESFEIDPREFIPRRPYYAETNYSFFHPVRN